MTGTGTLSPVVPAQMVLDRTVTLLLDDNTTILAQEVFPPDTTSFTLDTDPNPGHTANLSVVDRNAKGPGNPSNVVALDLTGPVPTGAPDAPTLTFAWDTTPSTVKPRAVLSSKHR